MPEYDIDRPSGFIARLLVRSTRNPQGQERQITGRDARPIRDRMRPGWLGGIVAAALLAMGQAPAPLVGPGRTSQPELATSAGTVQPTPGLLATQVGVAVDRDGSRRRFRATVLRIDGGILTIATAAHCLSDADRGWPAALLFEGGIIAQGVVEAVARNPLYRPAQPRELPGPDNAIARLRFRLDGDGKAGTGDPIVGYPLGPQAQPRPIVDPAAQAAFRSIQRMGSLASRPYPGPGGGTVAVRVIDGRGIEHAVRAGNHSNPRWLEWGQGYQPIPGDSGGGVFALAPSADGPARPVLIGVIVGRDDRGGGASLVSLDQTWIADALRSPVPAAIPQPAPLPALKPATRPGQ